MREKKKEKRKKNKNAKRRRVQNTDVYPTQHIEISDNVKNIMVKGFT